MQRFDLKSKRLIFFSTLSCLAILLIPAVQAFLIHEDVPQGTVIWSSRDKFDHPTEIRCDPVLDTVTLFDGINYVQRRHSNGALLTAAAVPNGSPFPTILYPDSVLSIDGKTLVTFGKIPYVRVPGSSQLIAIFQELQFWRMPGLTRGRKFPAFDTSVPRLMNAQGQIDSASIDGVGVWENYTVWPAKSTPVPVRPYSVYAMYNLKTGRRTAWPSQPEIRQGAAVNAWNPAGELLRGGIQRAVPVGAKRELFFEDINGQSHILHFDPLDVPGRNWESWRCPTLLFDKGQIRAWGATQSWDFTRQPGSVICWDWKKGTPLWRWAEPLAVPATIALSLDGKQLAVAASVYQSNNDLKGVRLVILNAVTGKLIRSLERDRNPKNNWQRLLGGRNASKAPDAIRGNQVIYGLSWAPDGKSLLAAYADGELICWQTYG